MQDEEWIARLVVPYVSAACARAEALRRALGRDDLLRAHFERTIPTEGRTTEGLSFRFHGTGCWTSDGELTVDFEFTLDGEVGGFDAWRLHRFSKENPMIVGTRSHEEMLDVIDCLRASGLIQTVEGSSLLRLPLVH